MGAVGMPLLIPNVDADPPCKPEQPLRSLIEEGQFRLRDTEGHPITMDNIYNYLATKDEFTKIKVTFDTPYLARSDLIRAYSITTAVIPRTNTTVHHPSLHGLIPYHSDVERAALAGLMRLVMNEIQASPMESMAEERERIVRDRQKESMGYARMKALPSTLTFVDVIESHVHDRNDTHCRPSVYIPLTNTHIHIYPPNTEDLPSKSGRAEIPKRADLGHAPPGLYPGGYRVQRRDDDEIARMAEPDDVPHKRGATGKLDRRRDRRSFRRTFDEQHEEQKWRQKASQVDSPALNEVQSAFSSFRKDLTATERKGHPLPRIFRDRTEDLKRSVEDIVRRQQSQIHDLQNRLNQVSIDNSRRTKVIVSEDEEDHEEPQDGKKKTKGKEKNKKLKAAWKGSEEFDEDLGGGGDRDGGNGFGGGGSSGGSGLCV
ncbi:hypothetical protein HK097_007541 [Rhizophlyctis rosea]|uniref:Uncharacterized protein n=1 Tax=Rhizophlyctis rosea TaxID=64517 RepID=A0AAD5SEJ3_9FUNG|nr:hypothetical protein HK097_007541 [Rhizophlyctis rosea]